MSDRLLLWEQKLLIVICVLLAAIVVLLVLNINGRYQIAAGNTFGTCYVLDSKTSKVWLRTASQNVYMGTNENPAGLSIK